MNAPGDNLEFHGSDYFKRRAPDASPQALAVQAAIKNRPGLGATVAGPVRQVQIAVAGDLWTVFFSRQANRVGLMHIFSAHEWELAEHYEAELKALFEKGGGR